MSLEPAAAVGVALPLGEEVLGQGLGDGSVQPANAHVIAVEGDEGGGHHVAADENAKDPPTLGVQSQRLQQHNS